MNKEKYFEIENKLIKIDYEMDYLNRVFHNLDETEKVRYEALNKVITLHKEQGELLVELEKVAFKDYKESISVGRDYCPKECGDKKNCLKCEVHIEFEKWWEEIERINS